MKLNKLDVALRQLETACKMFFNDDDPISIHTLVCASHEILTQMGKQSQVKSILREPEYIKPECKDKFLKMINDSRNFFKHANPNNPAEYDFNIEENELWLLDACQMYMKITGKKPFWIHALQSWLIVHRTDMFLYSNEEKEKISQARSVTKSKKQFIEYFQTSIQKSHMTGSRRS